MIKRSTEIARDWNMPQESCSIIAFCIWWSLSSLEVRLGHVVTPLGAPDSPLVFVMVADVWASSGRSVSQQVMRGHRDNVMVSYPGYADDILLFPSSNKASLESRDAGC